MLLKPGEKTYTQRCRLFIGNLPSDISEEQFKKLFAKYGEPSEVFINKGKGFGFIRLESRALAEIAKAELDDTPMRGRLLRVRFATHSAALSVKNLSPFVSNELLEEAFSQFGMVERSIVIVDDRGRSTGKGIVEFASKPAARKALDRCNEGVFLLTTSPRPVIVEPLEQFDDEDGLPEKLAQKNPRYNAEREEPPRFARPGTFEFEYSKRWKSLDEMEKQQRQQVEKNMREAREKLESEMEDAYHEHQANLLRQDLLRRQEELRRMEELHSQEMQKRKEMQIRQEEERRRREEEMLRKREMEEQMRRQREENYRMGNFIDREREMRMNPGGALGMGGIASEFFNDFLKNLDFRFKLVAMLDFYKPEDNPVFIVLSVNSRWSLDLLKEADHPLRLTVVINYCHSVRFQLLEEPQCFRCWVTLVSWGFGCQPWRRSRRRQDDPDELKANEKRLNGSGLRRLTRTLS
ncbi:hypothetical protein F2P81_023070 [Scophthalmus maximus]|uniref:RRM domain-containing protein n=1 Tax=Scophthalmus maximus TaxID=52904 RepID=A0A6A4RWI1_SCOMX|nr:hypothetical protein F2P81_023070 [Scophthalmus maximus]